MKKRQKARFLSLRSSKIIVTNENWGKEKKKERRKEKEKKKKKAVYNSHFWDSVIKNPARYKLAQEYVKM